MFSGVLARTVLILYCMQLHCILAIPKPTSSTSYWSVLGFADSALNRIYIGDAAFTENEEARAIISNQFALPEYKNPCLSVMVDVNADLKHIWNHLRFVRDLILMRSNLMLFTSDFKKQGIRTLLHQEFLNSQWSTLQHLQIQVDSENFAHCLGLIRFFPGAHLDQCTIYLESLPNVLERKPFDTNKLLHMNQDLFPDAKEMELVLIREPIYNPQAFCDNMEWVKALMYKMNVEIFQLSFDAALSIADIGPLETVLKPNWQFDAALSDDVHTGEKRKTNPETGTGTGIGTGTETETDSEFEFFVVFRKYRDEHQDYLNSRNTWIKANHFWVQHAKANPY